MREILLSHGSGGEETWQLITGLFFRFFSNPILTAMEDSAVLGINAKIAFTTDSFTVKPVFFKGGNIGKLAVAGTVNDMAVVDTMGTRRVISLHLLPDPSCLGDYVLVHVGYAIQKIDRATAVDGLELMREAIGALENK